MSDLNPYEEGLALELQAAQFRIKEKNDRIEQLAVTNEALTAERDEQIEWVKRLADDLISAEAKLATCEKYRYAYAECDRIGTQAMRDLEAKLAENEVRLRKAVELLEAWGDVAVHCSIEEGVCCCGDNMENHTNPMDCGHTPLDHGTYIAIQLAEETRATLAEIKGESHE